MIKRFVCHHSDSLGLSLVQSLSWDDPLEKVWQPTLVLLPGEFHGQRSLAGYSPWGCKSQSQLSDKHFHISTDIMVMGPKQNGTKQNGIVTEEKGNKCPSSLDKDERQQLFHHLIFFICCQG